MCGIAGILSTDRANITPERLKFMTDALAHRGPDGEGHWIDPSGSAGFGHRRLSIIDLSPAGAQPMSCLDRYSIIHNGEIYNHIELRDFLQSKGYSFFSRTDTEIIPAAYDFYGPDCVRQFDGMFAFALWDRRERTLYLARDRFGEKPLFLYKDGTQLLFASEMKALWAAGAPKTINPPMLFNFITIGYTQNPADPSETFYKGITKLPARSWFRYNPVTRQKELRQYWDPIPRPAEAPDRSRISHPGGIRFPAFGIHPTQAAKRCCHRLKPQRRPRQLGNRRLYPGPAQPAKDAADILSHFSRLRKRRILLHRQGHQPF